MIPLRHSDISREVLLLRSGVDLTADDGVGDEAAACIAIVRPAIFKLVKLQVTFDVDASQRAGLGNSPHHSAIFRSDLDVFGRTPEVVKGAGVWVVRAILGLEGLQSHIIGLFTEPVNGNIVANIDVQIILARLKHNSVAIVIELTVAVGLGSTLSSENSVQD
jgi:hypothetical protein